MLPLVITPLPLFKTVSLPTDRKMVFMQELKMPSQHQLFANNPVKNNRKKIHPVVNNHVNRT